MKKIYAAVNLDDAEFAREEFREKWDRQYPNILKSGDKNWEVGKSANFSAALHRISCSCAGALSSVALFCGIFSIGTFSYLLTIDPKKLTAAHYPIP